jgi:uncharacterized membrane protein
VPKNRLEAFADGIFAFAATLLILNLMVSGVSVGAELLQIWPSYVAYAVSFITIGIIWINHHTVMHQIAHVNRLFLVLNVFFLMMIAFIPFPTRLLALYVNDPRQAEAAAIAYGVTLTLTAVFINLLWRYAASGRRLLRENADARVVEGISRSYLPGPFIYLAGTAVALVSPRGSALIYVGIAVFYVLESSIFGSHRQT